LTEKEREKTRRELRKVGDEFLKVVKEVVDNQVLLCNVEGLAELVSAVDVLMGHQLVKTIKEKGFSKEFTEFCDKVGRGKK